MRIIPNPFYTICLDIRDKICGTADEKVCATVSLTTIISYVALGALYASVAFQTAQPLLMLLPALFISMPATGVGAGSYLMYEGIKVAFSNLASAFALVFVGGVTCEYFSQRIEGFAEPHLYLTLTQAGRFLSKYI